MKKRILCMLLSIVMVLSLLPAAALAADGEINLSELLEGGVNSDGTYHIAADTYGRVIVDKNIELQAPLKVVGGGAENGGPVTLDLNGCTLTAPADGAFFAAEDSALYVTDDSEAKTGRVDGTVVAQRDEPLGQILILRGTYTEDPSAFTSYGNVVQSGGEWKVNLSGEAIAFMRGAGGWKYGYFVTTNGYIDPAYQTVDDPGHYDLNYNNFYGWCYRGSDGLYYDLNELKTFADTGEMPELRFEANGYYELAALYIAKAWAVNLYKDSYEGAELLIELKTGEFDALAGDSGVVPVDMSGVAAPTHPTDETLSFVEWVTPVFAEDEEVGEYVAGFTTFDPDNVDYNKDVYPAWSIDYTVGFSTDAPGASITAVNAATGESVTGETRDDGYTYFTFNRAENYNITFSASGYYSVTRNTAAEYENWQGSVKGMCDLMFGYYGLGGAIVTAYVPLTAVTTTPTPTPTPTPDPEPQPEQVTVPISGDESSIQVGASVSGTTATIDEVDLSALDTVIGDEVETGTVTIDFSGLETGEPINTVALPADVIQQIAEAVSNPENNAESLEIVLPGGTSIEFDAEALANKAAQADGLDITISIEHSDDAQINDTQRENIGDRPAYDINVTSGGEPISDMGGRISVHAPYELRDGEKPEGIVVYYVDEHGGRERCETSYDSARRRVNWATSHLSLYVIEYEEPVEEVCPRDGTCPLAGFSDLDVNEWYHDGIHYCLENGIFAGMTETEFGPDVPLTRAMFVSLLWRLEGRPVVNYLMQYEDVDEAEYYAEAVRWAASEKIVYGYGGTFGVSDEITREDFVTILYRYAQYKGYDVSVGENTNILSYSDAEAASEYAIPALQWACGAGIISGDTDESGELVLDPEGETTRAQAARMLTMFSEAAAK